ncbi:MAG: PadR family transcriptional regulator [Acidimicrobiales bacterium]
MCRRCGCLGPGRTAPVRAAPVEGMLEAAVLLACAEEPRYGYELGPWLTNQGLVPAAVSPGRLYETLAALSSQGALAVSDEPGERGPARRRYQLTDVGNARLDRWLESLERSASALARLLARGLQRPHLSHKPRRGGEAMPCQCHCGGPGASPAETASHAPAPAPERSVEKRLEVIEDLLQRLSTR